MTLGTSPTESTPTVPPLKRQGATFLRPSESDSPGTKKDIYLHNLALQRMYSAQANGIQYGEPVKKIKMMK